MNSSFITKGSDLQKQNLHSIFAFMKSKVIEDKKIMNTKLYIFTPYTNALTIEMQDLTGFKDTIFIENM